jgi:TolB protein
VGPARSDGAARVAIFGVSGSLQNPCWSPSGDRLALTNFERAYNEGVAVVRVVGAHGGRPLAVVGPKRAQSVNLPGSCWNGRDGLIAYTSDVAGADEVYTAAPGGRPRRVTRPPQVAFEPSFSPDGRWIAFESHRRSTRRGEIWKVGVDGKGLRRLTSGADDREPNWSPRGDRVVFQRHARGRVRLWTADPDGRGLRLITPAADLKATDASWSPSGRYVVFSAGGLGIAGASLFTVDAHGGDPLRLTSAQGAYDGAPSWSPDGRTIAFESRIGNPDGSPGTQIWAIAAPPGRS